MSVTSREWQLTARPVGEPKPTDFRLVQAEVADPGPGQILVRNTWMSVDPYMRGRMNDVKSYVPPFQIGAVVEAGAVGYVTHRRTPGSPLAPSSPACSAGKRSRSQTAKA